MYSQCPDCQTRFRVTAEALRAARGTVRCGRCGSAFDALERLSDSLPDANPATLVPAAIAVGATATSIGEPQSGAGMQFSAEDLERVFVDSRDWQAKYGTPPSRADAEALESADEVPVVVVDEDTGFEDITLEGERIRIESLPDTESPDDEVEPVDEYALLRDVPEAEFPEDDGTEIEELVKQLTGEFEVPRFEPEPAAEAVAPAADEREAPVTAAVSGAAAPAPWRWQPPPQPADALPDFEPTEQPFAWGRVAWAAGSLLLALLLAAQVVHRYRQDLVRHPQLGGPLRATYAGLGLPLTPNWDLGAFELRQWGNDPDAPQDGRMVVRASLTNRADFAQPHPMLRVELDDRYGATVATRDFEPGEYLKDPSQATRLISAGSTIEAELLLADPGPEAVGYRLDVCLRESATQLRCARGPG